MLSVIVGILMIGCGILWAAMVYLAEGMRPTGGQASNLWPALFGLAAVVVGVLLIIYR